MEIWPRTAPCPAGSSKVANTDRLAPGDVIQGRILNISPSGRTLLQIGPYQFESNRPMSGNPGDTLLFEIQPRPSPGADGDLAKVPLLIRLVKEPRAVRRSIERMTPGKARDLPPGFPDRRRGAASRPLEPRRELSLSQKEVLAGKESLGGEKCLPRTAETWDFTSGFKIEADADGCNRVLIKTKTRESDQGRDMAGRILTAALVLDLENTGSVEVEVHMVKEQIRVKFKVASEEVEKRVRSEINGMRAALKHLASEIYCYVQVDDQLGGGFSSGNRNDRVEKGIDCTI